MNKLVPHSLSMASISLSTMDTTCLVGTLERIIEGLSKLEDPDSTHHDIADRILSTLPGRAFVDITVRYPGGTYGLSQWCGGAGDPTTLGCGWTGQSLPIVALPSPCEPTQFGSIVLFRLATPGQSLSYLKFELENAVSKYGPWPLDPEWYYPVQIEPLPSPGIGMDSPDLFPTRPPLRRRR